MWWVTIPTRRDAFAITQLHANLLEANTSGDAAYREWLQLRVQFRRSLANTEEVAASIEKTMQFWRIAEIAHSRELIGFICGVCNFERQSLESLYVAEMFHGKGVADALMQAFLRGINPSHPIILSVAPDNMRARRFYRRYGFCEEENSLHYFNDMQPLIKMIRSLRTSHANI